MAEQSYSDYQTARLDESPNFKNCNVLVIISFGDFARTKNDHGFNSHRQAMLDMAGVDVNNVIREEDSAGRVTYYFYLKVVDINYLAGLLVRSYRYPRNWAVDTLYVAIYAGATYQKIAETYYDKDRSYLRSDRFSLTDNLDKPVELKNSLRDSVGEVNLDCFEDDPIKHISNLEDALEGVSPKS